MSLPAASLSQKLTRPLPIRDGAVLLTIRCVTIYMLAMPQEHAEGCQRWRRAAQLLLDQAEGVVVATAGPGRQAGAVTPRDFCGPQPSHQRSSASSPWR